MSSDHAELPTLFSFWRSGSAWRVRLALHYKGIAFNYHAVNIMKGEEMEPEYQKMYAGGVPCWKDVDGNVLGQSMAILELLEDAYPEAPKLLPTGVFARGQARAIALAIVSGIQPLQNGYYVGKVLKDASQEQKNSMCREVITEGLWGVEELLKASTGDYCVGNAPSVADCCLVPQVYHAKRFGVDLTPFPIINKVVATVEAQPWAVKAHPDSQPDKPAAAK